MRALTIITLVLMLTAGCFISRAQSSNNRQSANLPQPNYAISVAGPSEPIKIGGPITVTVTVSNISRQDIYWHSEIGKNSAYRSFTFLLSKDGNEAATTYFHRRVSGRQREGDPQEVPGSGSSILLPHPPGKMFEIPIDVNRLYQITEAGTYTFRVCRHDEVSKKMVCSNDLILRVEP